MSSPAMPGHEEIERWTTKRRPHEHEPVPAPGERLLFREHEFGEPVPAVVDQVQDMTTPNDHWGVPGADPDPNVWRWHEETLRHRMLDDPWPWVAVRVIRAGDDGEEILAAPRWTKEARVRGSTGWMRSGSRAHTGQYGESER